MLEHAAPRLGRERGGRPPLPTERKIKISNASEHAMLRFEVVIDPANRGYVGEREARLKGEG